MDTTERNLAAETRAVEEGHRAISTPRPRTYRVVSDTKPGKTYKVTAKALVSNEPVTFTCEPEGSGSYADDHLKAQSDKPGHAPCKHAALVARSMERKGQVHWAGGYWVSTPAFPFLKTDTPSDPFAGLPS